MADDKHPQTDLRRLLTTLFLRQQFWIVKKVPQEPAQLPHRFLSTVETTHDGLTGGGTWFKDREPEDVEGLVRVPAELGAIDAHKEDAGGKFWPRIAGR